MTGVAKNTVTELLRDLGDACSEYQHCALRNLTCKRIQVDEIWCFVCAKSKNVPASKQLEMVGDVSSWGSSGNNHCSNPGTASAIIIANCPGRVRENHLSLIELFLQH